VRLGAALVWLGDGVVHVAEQRDFHVVTPIRV
jgi:hypothetical protein